MDLTLLAPPERSDVKCVLVEEFEDSVNCDGPDDRKLKYGLPEYLSTDSLEVICGNPDDADYFNMIFSLIPINPIVNPGVPYHDDAMIDSLAE